MLHGFVIHNTLKLFSFIVAFDFGQAALTWIVVGLVWYVEDTFDSLLPQLFFD